jgi:hypothetical protein
MEDVNNILTIHAEWLRDNGFTEESKECFKQAQQYSDLRQINGRKKYEVTKLHASSNRMGNAYRISRSS